MIRILHSLSALGMGGIETWLTNLVRQNHLDIHFDFCLEKPGGCYEEELRQYGCRMYYLPQRSRWQKRIDYLHSNVSMKFLKKLLSENQYDVFHCHAMEFSGREMEVAAKAGVPVRVVQSHNTQLARGKQGFEMIIRKAFFKTMNRKKILKYATDITACSNDSGRFFMGKYWNTEPKCRPLFCGVPLGDFLESGERTNSHITREQYGIPNDAIVVGHVGSMGHQKNPFFILDVFQNLFHKNDRYWLCMVGDGPLRDQLWQSAKKLGVASRVVMPGICHVPLVMPHVFDVLFFPSLYEGMPLVIVEATASGLYTVCSDTITRDVTDCFPDRIRTLSLQASISQWSDAVETAIAKRVSIEQGCQIVEKSPFSISTSLHSLICLYQNRFYPNDKNSHIPDHSSVIGDKNSQQ